MGACYFLDENGLRALHADHDWKPARCSVFPWGCTSSRATSASRSARRPASTARGLDFSERRVVGNLGAFLPELLWDLEDPTTRVEL